MNNVDESPLPMVSESDPVIESYKAGVDRTLIREMLRLTPEQRLRRIEDLGRFQEELHEAGRQLRNSR
jgi:hypothetical protein